MSSDILALYQCLKSLFKITEVVTYFQRYETLQIKQAVIRLNGNSPSYIHDHYIYICIQRSRNFGRVLSQCWTNVTNVGSALRQQWTVAPRPPGRLHTEHLLNQLIGAISMKCKMHGYQVNWAYIDNLNLIVHNSPQQH